MLSMIQDGGPFMLVVLTLGLVTLVPNLLQLAHRGRRLTGVVVGLAAATLLAGLCGTGAGLYMMASAFPGAVEPTVEGATQAVSLLARATGVAWTTTAMGALLAAVNAIICGVGFSRAR